MSLFRFAIVVFIAISSNKVYSQNRVIPLIENYTDSMFNNTLHPGMIVSYTCEDSVIYEKAKGIANIDSRADGFEDEMEN